MRQTHVGRKVDGLAGTKFGKLLVVSRAENKSGRIYWYCKCECGNTKNIRTDTLINGTAKSCGCKNKPIIDDTLAITIYNDLYTNQKMTLRQIAGLYGCSMSAISRAFIRNELKTRDTSVNSRRYHVNDHIFDSIDTEEKAYWLGFLYADGCVVINNRTYTTTLSLAETDILAVEEFSIFIFNESRVKIEFSKNIKRQNMAKVIVCSLHMAKMLENKGCIRKKAKTLIFPNWMPKELMNHFIRGYFDGDGHIGINIDTSRSNSYRKAAFNILSSTKFTTSLKDLFQQIGINSKMSQSHRCTKDSSTLVVCGNRQIQRVLDWMYKDATIYLQRKYDKYQELCNLNKGKDKRKCYPSKNT